MNPLQLALGGLLLFFLPGYALLRAALPDVRLAPGRWHTPTLIFLSVLLSTALLVLVGGALGFLGHFHTLPLTASLLGTSAMLLAVAWRRGAFTRVQRAASEPDGGDRLAEAVRWKARAEAAKRQGLGENARTAMERAHRAEAEASRERFGGKPDRMERVRVKP